MNAETRAARGGGTAFYALVALCVLALAGDLAVDHHGPFAIEHVFGFYGAYAFLASVVLMLAGVALKRVLTRPEADDDE